MIKLKDFFHTFLFKLLLVKFQIKFRFKMNTIDNEMQVLDETHSLKENEDTLQDKKKVLLDELNQTEMPSKKVMLDE